MIEIDSGDVMHMRDVHFSEILNEINSKTRQTRMSATFAWTAFAVGVVAGLATGGPGFLLCTIALPANLIGKWLDSYRRTTVLFYDLEGDAESAYRRLAEGFDTLIGCAAKWHIESGGAVQNLNTWKRNAGASHLVSRKMTKLAYDLPTVIRCNVTPPALHVGRQVMFFMPDIVLVQDGSRVGAVRYADLNVRWQSSRFIETDPLPSDAKIVDHTWKHPNKSGGPDKRFKDNRRIPICLYESLHITSSTGVNELVEFSRTGVVADFADGCRMLAALPRERTSALPSAPVSNATDLVPVPTSEKRSPIKTALMTALGIFVSVPVVAMVFGLGSKKAATDFPPHVLELKSGTQSPSEKRAAPPGDMEDPQKPQGATDIEPVAAPPDPKIDQKVVVRYTKTAVNLREGPSTKFAVISVVPKGAEVLVQESKDGWSRVRLHEGAAGWMANSTITER